MTKRLVVLVCLLGLTSVALPAYAASAKIILTCSSLAGDLVTGSATVSLCSDSLCSEIVSCAPVQCDSSGVSAPRAWRLPVTRPSK